MRWRSLLVCSGAAPLAAFWLYRWARELVLGPDRDDFRDFYAAAYLGSHRGWSQLYDLRLQEFTAARLGLARGWLPYFNPPPLAWLLTPLTDVSFHVAFVIWTGLLALALFAIWLTIAPRGGGWTRAAHGLAALALFGVTFNLILGQVDPLVALAVAVAALMSASNRPVAAGACLVLIDIKPQVAFLIPLAVLAAGAWRTFLAWGLGSLVLAVASMLPLGPSNLQAYVEILVHRSALDQPSLRLDALLPLPHPLAYVLPAIAAGCALWVAFRLRERPGIPYAVGILGSLLAAPHLNVQDLTLLVVAGWIAWPAKLAITKPAWVAGGWFAIEAGIGTGIIALLFEIAMLVRLTVHAAREG